MRRPEYSFIADKINGGYYLVRTHNQSVAVFGIGGTNCDRKTALKQAREYCKNMFATLHIEG